MQGEGAQRGLYTSVHCPGTCQSHKAGGPHRTTARGGLGQVRGQARGGLVLLPLPMGKGGRGSVQ